MKEIETISERKAIEQAKKILEDAGINGYIQIVTKQGNSSKTILITVKEKTNGSSK